MRLVVCLSEKSVNSNVSKESRIATDAEVYGTTQKVIVDCKLLMSVCFSFFLSQKWTFHKSSFLARPLIFILPALCSFTCIRVLVCQLKISNVDCNGINQCFISVHHARPRIKAPFSFLLLASVAKCQWQVTPISPFPTMLPNAPKIWCCFLLLHVLLRY